MLVEILECLASANYPLESIPLPYSSDVGTIPAPADSPLECVAVLHPKIFRLTIVLGLSFDLGSNDRQRLSRWRKAAALHFSAPID
jgi:hypothetical protein